jgi:hypothetical protein
LLLFLEHLGGLFEPLVFQKPVDQVASRVFGLPFGLIPHRPRKQHLALDVDELGGHVDELCGRIYLVGLKLVNVGEELRGDLCNGDVVDVDVLLADEGQ